jgi:hypothetical protein
MVGLLIFQMMTEITYTCCCTVGGGRNQERNDINGVIVENANGREYIEAKVVIECTGEGDIAARAGCDFELLSREDNEPHSLCFTMDGVDWNEFRDYVRAHPDQIQPRGGTRDPEKRYELLEKNRKCGRLR